VGSLLFLKRVSLRYSPIALYTPKRIKVICGALFILGVATSLALFESGLYGYASSVDTRESALGFLQWAGVLANLLKAALVVSAIEVFGKPYPSPYMKLVFGLSTAFSIALGALSGSKGSTLMPLLVLALVYSITRGRIPRGAILIPFLLILIYPFGEAYRQNLNGGYRAQANTLSGLDAVIVKTVKDVVSDPFSARQRTAKTLNAATSRLSILTAAHDLIDLPDPSQLNGDEKVWMAPIYPLIPRFLWKEKPVLNKGQRLSIALGGTSTSSAAITPVADLFSMYGTYGVLVGMFIYGVCLHLYMNWMGREAFSERRLFVYLSMLMGLINLEESVVGLIAGAVQSIIISVLISYVIYGARAPQLRALKHPRSSEAA
jgi:hypothetical protein